MSDEKVQELEAAAEENAATRWEPRFDAVMRKYYGRVETADLIAYFKRNGKDFDNQYIYKRAWKLGLARKRGS